MRHYVFVVHNSIQRIHSRPNVLSHSRVADARTSVVVNHGLHSKLGLESHSSDFRECSSQAMPCSHNGGSRMFVEQISDDFVYSALNNKIVREKSCVYFAAFAVVRSFLDMNVFNHVLNICRSSKRYYDFIFCVFVANEARSKSEWVVDVYYVYKIGQIFGCFATPCIQAFLGTISQSRIQGVFSGLGYVITVPV